MFRTYDTRDRLRRYTWRRSRYGVNALGPPAESTLWQTSASRSLWGGLLAGYEPRSWLHLSLLLAKTAPETLDSASARAASLGVVLGPAVDRGAKARGSVSDGTLLDRIGALRRAGFRPWRSLGPIGTSVQPCWPRANVP